ncbi:NADH-ubiquinone oxidoreductase [Delitschia confertaspora ATCC 74209]|uniref:NADH-ubiquinone oxidoreductase n=1 Tax=Delitschia confertaspora ATCC 74209 TaxID=1513339 RepID=A0A9P4JRD6_9PLEO|nr:NADH-ubiquinone oxidoreductase [Delitschia confertaspora ATCC 74209]
MLASSLRTRTRLLSQAPKLFRAHNTSIHQVPANDPSPKPPKENVSGTNAVPTSPEGMHDATLQESVETGTEIRTTQAPNRKGIWSRSQQPREVAMSGPRFEQTIFADQPRPMAAIELIHKQPVRWVKDRMVSCDGGGGPLGHPKVFINTDKPQISWCTYCGLPFAQEKHRKHLESLPSTSYPLEPTGHEAEVGEAQRITNEPRVQR